MPIREAPIGHLVQMIASGGGRFSMLLGAGASRPSGIPTAGELADKFRAELTRRFGRDPQGASTFEEWLEKQPGFEKCGGDYGTFFSVFEPKRAGRQRYIASIVNGKEPSFGYFCMSQLIERRLIGPVLTTNFDDLVWDACARFTLVRPIVLAYGTVTFATTLLEQRPVILKLHGDFLYSALVNLKSEEERQDANMVNHCIETFAHHGLVVLGYSGSDESILKVLENFPPDNDLYWCVRNESKLSPEVEALIERKEGYVVQIPGFDEFMDELLHEVGFRLSDADELVRQNRRAINGVINSSTSKYHQEYVERAKLEFEADQATREGRLETAAEAYEQMLGRNITFDFQTAARYADILHRLARIERAVSILKPFEGSDVFDQRARLRYASMRCDLADYGSALPHLEELAVHEPNVVNMQNLALALGHVGETGRALSLFRRAMTLEPEDYLIRANLSVLLARTDSVVDSRRELGLIPPKAFKTPTIGATAAMAYCHLGDFRMAYKLVARAAHEEGRVGIVLARDPDFQKLRDHPRYRARITRLLAKVEGTHSQSPMRLHHFA